MKKILSLLLIIALAIGLVSCGGKNKDIPEGMQLVRGGSDIGYYMYAPEEWTVSNQGSISAAYASGVDNSSVTYTEVEPPLMSVAEYFAESSKSYAANMNFTLLCDSEGNAIKFGNADKATKFEFDFEYSGRKFRSMQILAEYGDRFGIFTFTALRENVSSDDVIQYDYFKEKVDAIILNFKYVEKTDSTNEPEYETKDGYKLISDKTVAKFKLYVPEDFKVEYSSGIVSAIMPDGSSINMAKATETNVRVDEYLSRRIDELKGIVSDVTVIQHEDSEGNKTNFNSKDSLGNSKSAASQEYTFVYNGVTYHVYQICAITTLNGFVFTYTATEENYEKNLAVVKKIIEKVEF